MLSYGSRRSNDWKEEGKRTKKENRTQLIGSLLQSLPDESNERIAEERNADEPKFAR
jgi:hypothetical protein